MPKSIIPAKLPKDYQFNPLPKGWYVAAFSHEIKDGDVVGKTFMAQEIVVYRDWRGKAVVVDAYCPHMGAHFAHGGTIEEDNTLKCPFHGFCFNDEGKCVKTGYGTKPSPRARMKSWPVKEMHGVILVYNHPDEKVPSWEVPDLDMTGWSKVKFKEWKMKANSQETAENAVDVGHFFAIHKYDEVEVIDPLRLEGPFLFAEYGMSRSKKGFFGSDKQRFKFQFKIHKYGLGYSCVEARVPEFGLTTRQFVFVTPYDKENAFLRLGMSIKNDSVVPKKISPFLAPLPKFLVRALVLNAGFRSYQNDVSQDFKIWNNKKYVHPPALSKGDGPIMEYRTWAHQFD